MIDVAARDFDEEIKALDQTLSGVEQVLDPARMREQISDLERDAAAPNLWEDLERAQRITSELSSLQAELRRLTELRQRVNDLPVMFELAEEESDATAAAEAERELDEVTHLV